MMTICNNVHSVSGLFLNSYTTTKVALVVICSGCAYEPGNKAGLERLEQLKLDTDSLPESQAGTVRHKSPYAAFAIGYQDDVYTSYRTQDK
ncbi:TPA: hypothetical protein ACGF8O_000687 [Vibrio cholerae]